MTEPEKDSLSDRIARAQAAHDTQPPDTNSDQQGSSNAGAQTLRYGAELGACVIVSILLGIGIDQIFNTSPWGVLIMLGFGLAAGVFGVIRAYRELTSETEAAENRSDSRKDVEE